MSKIIYLDNAATTYPKPEAVYRSVDECMREYGGNPGRGTHSLAMRAAEKIYDCREMIAQFFCAPSPESVVFTYNTTYALNIAIKSHLVYGSHLLISDIEHNSVLRPVHESTARGYCSFDIFPTIGGDDAVIAAILQRVKLNTRMVICNHLSNIGSRILPIKRISQICHERNIILIVDGAQSAGTIPISIQEQGIDILCVPGHKGLYGPQGVGVMIVASALPSRTFVEGGSGIHSLERDMPLFLPERHEAGTLATPSIAGLLAGLQWIRQHGIDKLALEEQRLSHIAQKWLSDIPDVTVYPMDTNITNTFCFNVNHKTSQEVGERLNAHGICVRAGFHCAPLAHEGLQTGKYGAVRVSIGAFNRLDEISTLCNVTEKISRE